GLSAHARPGEVLSPTRPRRPPNGPVQAAGPRDDTSGERHVESSKPPEHQVGRSTGRRGPVVVALAAVGVFVFGALSGGFHRLFDRLMSSSPSVTSNLIAFLMT